MTHLVQVSVIWSHPRIEWLWNQLHQTFEQWGSLRAWGGGGRGGGGEGKVYKPANADLGVFPALT